MAGWQNYSKMISRNSVKRGAKRSKSRIKNLETQTKKLERALRKHEKRYSLLADERIHGKYANVQSLVYSELPFNPNGHHCSCIHVQQMDYDAGLKIVGEAIENAGVINNGHKKMKKMSSENLLQQSPENISENLNEKLSENLSETAEIETVSETSISDDSDIDFIKRRRSIPRDNFRTWVLNGQANESDNDAPDIHDTEVQCKRKGRDSNKNDEKSQKDNCTPQRIRKIATEDYSVSRPGSKAVISRTPGKASRHSARSAFSSCCRCKDCKTVEGREAVLKSAADARERSILASRMNGMRKDLRERQGKLKTLKERTLEYSLQQLDVRNEDSLRHALALSDDLRLLELRDVYHKAHDMFYNHLGEDKCESQDFGEASSDADRLSEYKEDVEDKKNSQMNFSHGENTIRKDESNIERVDNNYNVNLGDGILDALDSTTGSQILFVHSGDIEESDLRTNLDVLRMNLTRLSMVQEEDCNSLEEIDSDNGDDENYGDVTSNVNNEHSKSGEPPNEHCETGVKNGSISTVRRPEGLKASNSEASKSVESFTLTGSLRTAESLEYSPDAMNTRNRVSSASNSQGKHDTITSTTTENEKSGDLYRGEMERKPSNDVLPFSSKEEERDMNEAPTPSKGGKDGIIKQHDEENKDQDKSIDGHKTANQGQQVSPFSAIKSTRRPSGNLPLSELKLLSDKHLALRHFAKLKGDDFQPKDAVRSLNEARKSEVDLDAFVQKHVRKGETLENSTYVKSVVRGGDKHVAKQKKHELDAKEHKRIVDKLDFKYEMTRELRNLTIEHMITRSFSYSYCHVIPPYMKTKWDRRPKRAFLRGVYENKLNDHDIEVAERETLTRLDRDIVIEENLGIKSTQPQSPRLGTRRLSYPAASKPKAKAKRSQTTDDLRRKKGNMISVDSLPETRSSTRTTSSRQSQPRCYRSLQTSPSKAGLEDLTNTPSNGDDGDRYHTIKDVFARITERHRFRDNAHLMRSIVRLATKKYNSSKDQSSQDLDISSEAEDNFEDFDKSTFTSPTRLRHTSQLRERFLIHRTDSKRITRRGSQGFSASNHPLNTRNSLPPIANSPSLSSVNY